VTKSLFTSLLRLFGGARAPDRRLPDPADAESRFRQTVSRVAPPTATASAGQAPASGGPLPFEGDPDRRFTALVLGVGDLRCAAAEPAELRVIEQIEQVLRDSRGPNLVPRLPVVLPRLIGLVRRDDVSPRDLVEPLSHDPALVGEVVRLANSPRFRPSRDIANLQEAVIALGQRGLVQLVTNAVMRPIFDTRQGRFSRAAGTRLWDLTERCSFACANLCGDAADPFQAYLAGMVANLGFIAALRVLDTAYRKSTPPDTEGFHDALCDVVVSLSAQIARQWDFPASVCEAVAQRPTSRAATAGDDLVQALRTADRVSKWHVLMPGLGSTALAGLTEAERRCYVGLERTFGH
jgi:HD-like signal output (HDOD) protein